MSKTAAFFQHSYFLQSTDISRGWVFLVLILLLVEYFCFALRSDLDYHQGATLT